MSVYACAVCGVSEVKLWRQFMQTEPLRCIDCTCAHERVDSRTVRSDGRIKDAYTLWTLQIGKSIPAVPMKCDGSLLSYAIETDETRAWWDALPLRDVAFSEGDVSE